MADAAEPGRIPTLHVVADCIPRAYYRAVKAVWEQGLAIRTEYDRKDASGAYIDPPSRDARVLIEVTDPFAEPRFPPVSFCEIGVYIAEIMGLKDHMVVPMAKLREAVGGELDAQEWPYTYHQRLYDHPDVTDGRVNQIALALDRLAKTPYSRRAVATTAVPNIDPFLKEDIPCLREMQLRCPEDGEGGLLLNMNTTWRSRDLFKAWADNVIALTFMQQKLAARLEQLSERPCRAGSYADYSMSLHIYGQDFAAVGGSAERGIQSLFDTFDEESFVARALTSEMARDMLVLPQLRDLLTPRQIEQWRLPAESVALVEELIEDLCSGAFLP